MSKKDKNDEDPDNDWRYDGAASKWDRFDSKVGRYARRRLSTLGDAFWKGFLGAQAKSPGINRALRQKPTYKK